MYVFTAREKYLLPQVGMITRINQRTASRQDRAPTSLYGSSRHAPPAHGNAHHATRCVKSPTEGRFDIARRMTAAEFCVTPMTAMQNEKLLPDMVDCEYSLVQSQCRKADIEIAND